MTIAVVAGCQRDDKVTTVAVARCQPQHAGAIATGDERCKARQADKADRDRVAIGIGHRNRHLQHLALADGLCAQCRHHRRPVGIAHQHRHGQGADQGHTRAVAVVGGAEYQAVAAGLVIARPPRHHRRQGVEAGAWRQRQGLIGDAGRAGLNLDQRAVGQPVRRDIARVVRVERKGADVEQFTFEQADRIKPVKHRRGIDVADGE